MAHFLIEVPDTITIVDGSAAFSRTEQRPVTPEAMRTALTINSYHQKAYFPDEGAVVVRALTQQQAAALADDVGS